VGLAVTALVVTGCSGGAGQRQNGTAWVPAAPPAATARLAASVRFSGTQFTIENHSTAMWRDVVVDIYRGAGTPPFRYRADAVLGGRAITIGALHFEAPDGRRFSPFAGVPDAFGVTARLPEGAIGFAGGPIRESPP
jgi:hypothetical protein